MLRRTSAKLLCRCADGWGMQVSWSVALHASPGRKDLRTGRAQRDYGHAVLPSDCGTARTLAGFSRPSNGAVRRCSRDVLALAWGFMTDGQSEG